MFVSIGVKGYFQLAIVLQKKNIVSYFSNIIHINLRSAAKVSAQIGVKVQTCDCFLLFFDSWGKARQHKLPRLFLPCEFSSLQDLYAMDISLCSPF